MATIVVGMSGGVDSSVAAALLAEAGHRLIGITLRTAPWAEPEDDAAHFGSCCSPATARGARAVARHLGIPYYLLNHEREFAELVIADFTREYGAGRTPSPCVVCNREVKFGTLLRRALAWEADAVATGHYARIRQDGARGRLLLCRGRDVQKDQSYFLWPLTQAQLARARFPDRRPDQGRGPREGARARPGHGRHAGEPGALLRQRGLPRVSPRPRARGVPPGSHPGRGRARDRRPRRARGLHDRAAARPRDAAGRGTAPLRRPPRSGAERGGRRAA